MGMEDWHSGALKRGLTPLSGELGIHVCGGRGTHSRKTPHELAAIGERVGFDGKGLAIASRLVAKWTVPSFRRASISICTGSSSPMMGIGSSCRKA